MDLPTIDDVYQARQRIAPQTNATPLIRSNILDEKLQARVFLKPECFQRTGSFKFRGAFNAISLLGREAIKCGVIACSSGNHAQGLAEAGRVLGVAVTIVMPDDAPAIKRARTERSGAKIITYDRRTGDRDAITDEIARQSGAILVHPFNNPHVIAGQGTAGLEIVDELNAMSVTPDLVLVPTGGGGLLAGTTLAIRNSFIDAVIHPVEPEGFDDYRRSLIEGTVVSNVKTSGSVCDAIITPTAGDVGFAICKDVLGEGLVVSDEQALAATAFAWSELKCVVEPGAAVALAALLSGKVVTEGKNIVVVLSGGNIDPAILQRALANYKFG